jgi:UDP-glucose 4-epimerase
VRVAHKRASDLTVCYRTVIDGNHTSDKTDIKSVVREFILSSNLPVYGNPAQAPVNRGHADDPIPPYGFRHSTLRGMTYGPGNRVSVLPIIR